VNCKARTVAGLFDLKGRGSTTEAQKEMTMNFKPGDVVILKSDSALMTVEKAGKSSTGQDAVWCVWQETGKGGS
jgi:uncharacterized protein YodC (DUF2158 family)